MYLVQFNDKLHGVATKKHLPNFVQEMAEESKLLPGEVINLSTFCVFNTNKTKTSLLQPTNPLTDLVRATVSLNKTEEED